MNQPHDEELTRLATVARPDDWPYAGVLAAEVLRLRAEVAELKSRIDGALQILDDPDDLEEGICRAADVLWGEKQFPS